MLYKGSERENTVRKNMIRNKIVRKRTRPLTYVENNNDRCVRVICSIFSSWGWLENRIKAV